MSVKLDGETWKRFYSDKEVWGEFDYHDDYEILVNGMSASDGGFDLTTVSDSDTIEVVCGTIVRGRGGETTSDMVKDLKRWLKKQTTKMLMVEVEIGKEDGLIELIKNYGAKVVKK